jgi:hypothetical protein
MDLYRQTLVEAHRQMLAAAGDANDAVPALRAGEDPADALRRFVRFALRLHLLRRRAHVAGRLLAMELREPTAALGDVVKLVMTPVRAELERVIGALLHRDDTPDRRAAAADFVMATCFGYEQARPILAQFGRRPPDDEAGVDRLAAVAADFALGGIERLRPAGQHAAHRPPPAAVSACTSRR